MSSSTLTLPNGSNVTLVPLNLNQTNVESAKQPKRVQLYSKSLLALSIINILLSFISTFLQVATIVAFSAGLFRYHPGSLDIGGWGIWCSLFYAISGFTGYSASYNKKRSLIITSLVFAVFSLATSIVAATFAGIQAVNTHYHSVCSSYDSNWNTVQWWYECGVWGALEWTLMSISIIAFCINVAVVAVASVAICACCSNKKASSHQGVVAAVPTATTQFPLTVVPNYAAPLSPLGVQQSLYLATTTQTQQTYPLQKQQQLMSQQQSQLPLALQSQAAGSLIATAILADTNKY